jgi:hypothetical protein
MARLSMKTAHHLGKEEAERRLKDKLRVALEAHGRKATDLREEWSDGTLSFAFKTMGASVAGTMVVQDSEVRLAAEVPLRIALFKRLIERRIRAELGNLLS